MSFENNGTLTNAPPKIDKHETRKKMVSDKNGTPCEKMPEVYLPQAALSDFLKRILKFAI